MTAAITTKSGIKRRGFASLTPERRRELASLGGRTAHELGTAHKYDSESGRKASLIGHARRAAK